jgi:serine/threonine protein kinase
MVVQADDSSVPPTADAPSTADELRGVRPPVDRVRLAAAYERSARELFGSADRATLGRYQLRGESANGAMGVVWAAYDPHLERQVALKVLHPRRQWDDRAQERLVQEAKSLARLDHENVVGVHDVFTEGEQVVIVMEWVEGDTLADWQQARSWRDIVAMYAQAGRGLAAAHRGGVVHRDFKPKNAIVGDDGRIRVLDFGLARVAELSEVPQASGSSPDAIGSLRDPDATASLTATGALVGTPAYAAPEQLAGQAATPASDQFSFAVALHRALEGVPPFPGEVAADILASIRSGRIAVGDRALPSWLRATVARALAEQPEARFPSMEALVHELTRLRGWRRWRIPALVAASLATAVLAVVLPWHDPLAACDGGVAEVNGVWNAVESGRVQVALQALGSAPGAGEISDRVRSGIDSYRDGWMDLHRSACVAHRRGEQSAELLDRRMNCLRRRLGDLQATIAMVERLDAASQGNALEIVARTPRIEACADIDALQAATAQPAAEQRDAVEAVRRTISQAMGADRAGRSAERRPRPRTRAIRR